MPVVDLSQHAEEFNADPYPVYAKLRADGPAHMVRTPAGGETWLIVGHEEAKAALADPRFAKDWRPLAEEGYVELPVSSNMLETDPPQHTRLRKLVARESPRAASRRSARASRRSPTGSSTRCWPRPAAPPTSSTRSPSPSR